MNSRRVLRTGLALLICLQSVLSIFAQTVPLELQIVVVEGEGTINNIGQRSSRDATVRIEDENQKPVVGAAVVFTLPTEGASGEFANGSKNTIVMTDNRGIATAVGLKVNTVPGKLQIHVNASYRGRTARTNITQFNMSVPGQRVGGSGKKIFIILAVAGAAAAGGVTAATMNRSNTPTSSAPPVSSISITPGTGTIGPPR